jgi:hypothetical protein
LIFKFFPAIILDRNSQIYFHKPMIRAADKIISYAPCRAHSTA